MDAEIRTKNRPFAGENPRKQAIKKDNSTIKKDDWTKPGGNATMDTEMSFETGRN